MRRPITNDHVQCHDDTANIVPANMVHELIGCSKQCSAVTCATAAAAAADVDVVACAREVGGNDLIGAVEIPEVHELFLDGWQRFAEQQARPEAVKKMGEAELRREVQELFAVQLAKAKAVQERNHAQIEKIQKNQRKLSTMGTRKLREVLEAFDPKAEITNTNVRYPAPLRPGLQAVNSGA